MATEFDVIIAGGGLSGATLGIALAQAGLRAAVVEASSKKTLLDPEFDGRGYAIAQASQKMLAALGIWECVSTDSHPILDIKVTDGRPGEGGSPLHVHFNHFEIGDRPMGHVVEDRFLRAAVAAKQSELDGIVVFFEQSIEAQNPLSDRLEVQLSSGKKLTGKLIAGCDGKAGKTAARAEISTQGWNYNQASIVCAVAHELPHEGCAHQFFMPSGPLAILPLPGNRSSIVWTEPTDRAADICALSDAGFLAELRPRFGDFLGEITLAGKRFHYPLGLSVASDFVGERTALVGDAAHGIHPLAGQGFNLGLRDIAALTEVLTLAKRRGEDFGGRLVLERYQQWRRFDTASMVAATDGINRLFSNDNPGLRILRDLGLGAVNAVPFFRKQIIRQAAGLSGDLPKLMQGKSV